MSGDERSELHEPLGADSESVPQRLRERLAAVVRSQRLTPVVRLTTHRTVYRLRGQGDELLALFAVNRISRSGSPSKLARALGDSVPQHPEPEEVEPGTAGALLAAALREYRDEFVRNDPLVRADQPESIHNMRIAIARFRATVGTFHTLLPENEVSMLRRELDWIGHALGAVRDLDVIAVRLAGRLRTEPAPPVIGPIAERISRQLAQETLVAKTVLLDSLDSQRYFRILDAIDAFLADPRLSKSAAGTATEVLPRLVNHRIRALLAAIRSALETTDPPRHDQVLHEVRKAAKAVRYGAELLLAVRPNGARRLVEAAMQLQDTLGGQHDSVVVRHTLERLAAAAFLSGENTFTYGRLNPTDRTAR